MRRWQAIVLAAFVLVAGSYGGFTTTNVHAGAGPQPNDFTVSVDCNTSTGAIDSACPYSAGTTSITADVYLTNNSGGSVVVAAFNVTVRAAQQFLQPVVPGSCLAPKLGCNPDFNEGLGGLSWSCDPVLADQDPSPTLANSLISCSNTADAVEVANGAVVRLARISYTSDNGVAALDLIDVDVLDDTVTSLGSCNPALGAMTAICNNATVTIGGPVPTWTSTPVPTATPAPAATATPCPGICPTATRLGFSTVTPIVTPSVVPAATTAASDVPPPPPPPPPPPAPDGTTGGAGSRPIRLPDTGEGNGAGAGTWLTILAAITAVGAAGIASGAWFNARRRSEED
jgi:hypothetical protein